MSLWSVHIENVAKAKQNNHIMQKVLALIGAGWQRIF